MLRDTTMEDHISEIYTYIQKILMPATQQILSSKKTSGKLQQAESLVDLLIDAIQPGENVSDLIICEKRRQSALIWNVCQWEFDVLRNG